MSVNVSVLDRKFSTTTSDLFIIGQMTIDILPDDALLEVFSFYLVEASKHTEP